MASPSRVKPGTGLSPPASNVRIGDRALARPAQGGVIGSILRLLIRQPGLPIEQKFGAHQPDAVGIWRIRVFKILDALDIDQELYRLAAQDAVERAQNGTRRSPVLAQ